MQFSSSRGALEEALSMVAPIATTQSPIEALSCVVLSPMPTGIVKVYASNGSTSAVTLFSADVDDAITMAFTADKLFKWISGVNGTRVNIKPKGGDVNRLLLKSGHSQLTMAPYLTADFAMFMVADLDLNAKELFTVEREWLYDALGKAAVSAAKRNTNMPILEGVQFLSGGQDIYLLTTDSFRFTSLRKPINYLRHFDFVCHLSELKHLRRILKANDSFNEVTCYEVENAVYFRVGEVSLRMVKMQGQFPPILDMSEKQLESTGSFIEAGKDQITACLKRISLFTDEYNSSVTTIVVPHPEDEMADMTVIGGAREVGISKDILSVAAYGQPWKLALNTDFLLSAIKNIEGPIIRITKAEFGTGDSVYISTSTEDGVEPSYINFMMALDDVRMLDEDIS